MAARVVMLRSKSHGGVEPRIDKEARTLSGAGYDVHVVLWDRTGEYPREERREGYAVRRVFLPAPEGRASLVFKMPRWWRATRGILRDLRPQVIHAIDYDCLVPALRARPGLRAKVVYDIFDFYAAMIARPIPAWLRRWLAERERRAALRADLVILPDMARVAFFGRQHPERLIEVMNVPEERSVEARPQAQFTVFYGGQIARDRGLPELVHACEAVGAHLVVAGHGPDEGSLVPLIEASPAAMFLGTLPYDEVLRWTASCDAVAALYDPRIPNNRQASPNKLFEAMMLRRAVLTNEGTAVGDFVAREGLGVVAKYGDAESVRSALEGLFLSREARERMGLRGRQLYEERFRWAVMARRLVDAYHALLEGPDAAHEKGTAEATA